MLRKSSDFAAGGEMEKERHTQHHHVQHLQQLHKGEGAGDWAIIPPPCYRRSVVVGCGAWVGGL